MRQSENRAARSRQGMITTPHDAASEAGAKVLWRGGTAIEAVIAAGAALTVLYPHFCGLGGDAIWIVADGSGRRQTIMGIGQAAEHLPVLDAIPQRGPLSALTTAALVDSWGKALQYSSEAWHGTESLETLLADAIELAARGVPISRSQKHWHDFRAAEIPNWPGFEAHFVTEGIQRQPQLASVLERIALHGHREFYEGELAQRIANGLEAAGSPIRLRDMQKTAARMVDPLSMVYRGVELLAPPPPSQGMTTLGIMGVLQNFDMANVDPSSAEFYHLCVEAVKQAFLDRGAIADPDVVAQACGEWLNQTVLSRKAAAIDRHVARLWPAVHQTGDTVYLAAVDHAGRCASVLQSTYYDWGSGVLLRDTGILWQNRGAAFSTDPASPNVLAPGKRPFYTLNPGIGLRDGKPHLLYGTQGADGQPQTLTLLLSRLIDHGFDPLSALSAPRFLLGRTFSDTRDNLKIEASVGDEVIGKLQAMGHETIAIPALSALAGQAGVIRLNGDGWIDGAHDPRSDGCAIGM
ncbi:putative gamma-glutamyltranspeptidase [Agrobacterium rubi TR3 = NBRC 13261]|uniref:Putative gamma-glutamyltranspeptidase n=1 Tax=Agrobacterium rubi TR3 = NBRC 13261 TaxID=1368415 RepID=A0A081CZL0_9HYPH|nr:gamma-glutamyltransferase [Agrobacterium rubi]MBP1880424.1 gamma-glutamyltranspeptidase/glutathione hydrolase [Agrobacterium rubi]GAK72106.1 putative gamma-glutamyltranspeptidase [Agrobacterium rubi TR3 = NBRC 13261]